MTDFKGLAAEIGELVTAKNAAYGDSFGVSARFLSILYPNGIRPEQFKDVALIVRIVDKLMRIATDKDAFGESPYRDLAGYALLGIAQSTRLHDTADTVCSCTASFRDATAYAAGECAQHGVRWNMKGGA